MGTYAVERLAAEDTKAVVVAFVTNCAQVVDEHGELNREVVGKIIYAPKCSWGRNIYMGYTHMHKLLISGTFQQERFYRVYEDFVREREGGGIGVSSVRLGEAVLLHENRNAWNL